ncbi:MAG: hypothetical protein ACK4SY_07840 [Pyrobaculum sp.]
MHLSLANTHEEYIILCVTHAHTPANVVKERHSVITAPTRHVKRVPTSTHPHVSRKPLDKSRITTYLTPYAVSQTSWEKASPHLNGGKTCRNTNPATFGDIDNTEAPTRAPVGRAAQMAKWPQPMAKDA